LPRLGFGGFGGHFGLSVGGSFTDPAFAMVGAACRVNITGAT
jgi:hypothetical protein